MARALSDTRHRFCLRTASRANRVRPAPEKPRQRRRACPKGSRNLKRRVARSAPTSLPLKSIELKLYNPPISYRKTMRTTTRSPCQGARSHADERPCIDDLCTATKPFNGIFFTQRPRTLERPNIHRVAPFPNASKAGFAGSSSKRANVMKDSAEKASLACCSAISLRADSISLPSDH